ncbi:PsbP-like protein 2 [Striga asiatica]|uniref:PsbP-like protein 2 n=1 Tax=Striga asiatica TaxID=4170 RepID=A0A5A7QXQ1_STRAF|nr:PsbP-like protein 2 [Striga asiatica]
MPRKITLNSKMKNRSVILQKKLRELETELGDVIRIPLDPASPPGPLQQIAFDDIRKRFAFLRNLLSQEIASRPRNSGQLEEIGERLAALRSTFREWNDLRLSVLLRGGGSGESQDFSGGGPPGEVPRDSAAGGGAKGEECGQQVVPCGGSVVSGSDSNSDPEDSRCENTTDELFGVVEKDGDVKKEEEAAAVEENVWSRMGKYGGAFGCGMIVGAICTVRWFFVAFTPRLIEYEAILIPPT